MRESPSRRTFLKTSAALLAGGKLAGRLSEKPCRANEFLAPSEQPVAGIIGGGIRFAPFARASSRFIPCAAICDVDTRQSANAKQLMVGEQQKHGRTANIAMCDDYREVLDRKDIDVVIIATPDHWHTKMAIEAMEAGKDVYCEKPLTLTIREGQQILEVLKRTKKVFQVGTQQRSDFGQRFLQAVAMVHDGRVGQVRRVTCAIGESPSSPSLPAMSAPSELNWEKWLGQAPLTEYRQGELIHTEGWGAGYPLSRAHRYFRWWYEYSGGKLTDWGAHHVDIALWATNKLRSTIGQFTIDPVMVKHPVPFVDGMPTQDDRFNTATHFTVSVKFSDGLELVIRDNANEMGFDNGIMFEGSKGRFLVNRGKIVGKPVEDLADNPLPDDAVQKLYGGVLPMDNDGGDPIAHMNNFLTCVKSRSQPVSDVESHHRMLSVCHGANTAMRLGSKIVYDAATEQYVGNKQANGFIEREQRKGYEIHT